MAFVIKSKGRGRAQVHKMSLLLWSVYQMLSLSFIFRHNFQKTGRVLGKFCFIRQKEVLARTALGNSASKWVTIKPGLVTENQENFRTSKSKNILLTVR